jgi:small subunit ribosomal protein S8
MTLNDPLANVLSHIMMEDKKGVRQITVKPTSKLIKAVLNVLKDNNYLGELKEIDDGKAGVIDVSLLGKINKSGVIKPRYSVQVEEYKKFEKRYLPAFGFGFLVVSTNQGIMTQEAAAKKKIGGKLLAFVY